jgi:sugar lactone lactonase YvrE
VFADSVNGGARSSRVRSSRLLISVFAAALAATALLGVLGTGSASAALWATSTTFVEPTSIDVSSNGGVFVADSGNDRIVKFNRAGVRLQILGKRGGGQVEFRNPRGVTVEPGGAIFIADTGNYRIQRLYPSGTYQTEWGSEGTGTGYFRNPTGVTIDGSGNLYVADFGNDRVQKCNAWGWCGFSWNFEDGNDPGIVAPRAVDVGPGGNIFVTDTANSRIIKSSPSGELLDMWGTPGSGNGDMLNPAGVAVDGAGDVYVADTGNDRILKYSPDGTLIGQFGESGSAVDQFDAPSGLAWSAGFLYVADTGNNRVQKVQVGPDTEPDDNGGGGGNNGGGNNGGGDRPDVLISKVRLIPNKGWIYADGYLDMQVQVTNRGDGIARRVPVYLSSSREGVTVPRAVVMPQILPGWTVTRTFRVRAERRVRGWVMIQADSEGRRNRAFLKLIKPWWPASGNDTAAAGGGTGGGGGTGNGGGGDGGGKPSARPQVLISKVKLIPHQGWIYADGYLDMQVQVTNRGDGIARRIPVYLTSSRIGVKVARVVIIPQILPGWTVTRNFRVRAKRSARGWVMIQADTEGKRNRAFLKLIKPWW